MKMIPLTQGKYALVDDEDFEWLNQWKWCALKRKCGFYAVRGYRLPDRQVSVSMHRLILGVTDPKMDIDHKDGNGLNNQRYNLRPATRSQNNANRIHQRNSSSKYLGVSFYSSRGKWRARIKKDKKDVFLGYFEQEIEAALAYNNAAIKVHGEFCNLNKI